MQENMDIIKSYWFKWGLAFHMTKVGVGCFGGVFLLLKQKRKKKEKEKKNEGGREGWPP